MNQALMDRGFDLAARGLQLSKDDSPASREKAMQILDAACMAFRGSVASSGVTPAMKSFVLSKCEELERKQGELKKMAMTAATTVKFSQPSSELDSDNLLDRIHTLRTGATQFLSDDEFSARLAALKAKDPPASFDAPICEKQVLKPQLTDAQKAFVESLTDPKLREAVEKDLLASSSGKQN